MSSVVATPDLEGQPNNTRFKVVKIDGQRSTGHKSNPRGAEDGHVHEHILMPNGQKSFTYKRGRWTVTDFYDAPPLPAVPPIAMPVSAPSSNSNSTPSTPTLTTVLSPLSRFPPAAAPAPAEPLHPDPAPLSSLPTSPPLSEETAANPLAAPVTLNASNRGANPVEGHEHPVLSLTPLSLQPPVAAASSPITDAGVDAKDAEPPAEQSSLLSLPLLTSALSPDEGKNSQPESGTSSTTSPSVSDLKSLAKVIRAHPDVVHSAISPVKSGSDVSSESKEEAADEIEKVAAAGGPVSSAAVTETASGYATPASMHSVTGGNPAILPPYVSSVAIDNKIEQAMDLVKSHLMFAVREEVDVLKEKIVGLLERIQALETENAILKQSHEMQQHMNNQHTQSLLASLSMSASQPGSPVQPVNPDSAQAQELASLVSEVALTSPSSGEDTTAQPADVSDAHQSPAVDSAVSPEEEAK